MAAKKDHNAVANFFEYGLDIDSRTIYMGSTSREAWEESGVEFSMADRVVKGLHLLDRIEAPILIKMNNPGGDEYHGLAIYDAIAACRSHVTILGIGMVMSMGAWIMQAADERAMTPNATMMIHYGTWTYDGHSMDFDRMAGENRRTRRMMEDCFLGRIRQKHPKYTRARLRNKMLFDLFLDARQTLDLGLIDKIL